jgi:hypothetical protein
MRVPVWTVEAENRQPIGITTFILKRPSEGAMAGLDSCPSIVQCSANDFGNQAKKWGELLQPKRFTPS